jgi:hypothetical protein
MAFWAGDRLCFTDLDVAPFSRLRKERLSPSTAAGVGAWSRGPSAS